MKYRVFTVMSGLVSPGAIVEKFRIKNAGISIPAILVGQEGRGRKLGVLPVHLSPEEYSTWQSSGQVEIENASIEKTKTGNPKLIASDSSDTDDAIICVFRTKIGFRGSNNHTGDRCGQEKDEEGKAKILFSPFPGEVLTEGVIAQGDAGRMGSGQQLIALIPKGVVFRTAYTGRMYSAPGAHYYVWDGQNLLGGVTWHERQLTELF